MSTLTFNHRQLNTPVCVAAPHTVKSVVLVLIQMMVKGGKGLWLKQVHSSAEKAALSASCRLNLEVTSHLRQLLVMVQRIAAEWLMICRGNLYSRFWFLKQVPRHLVGILPSLRQGFTLKGQMEDDMLVRGQERTDIGTTAGLPGSERELCVQLVCLVTGWPSTGSWSEPSLQEVSVAFYQEGGILTFKENLDQWVVSASCIRVFRRCSSSKLDGTSYVDLFYTSKKSLMPIMEIKEKDEEKKGGYFEIRQPV